MKHNIMRCDKNILKPVPLDIFPKYSYQINPPHADLSDATSYKEVQSSVERSRAKREAFMVCALVSAMNEALRYYKLRACGENANFNETYTVYDDPASW